MVEAIRTVSGLTSLPERRFPWWSMRLLAPFGGFPREVLDIRPFWNQAVRLDGTRLSELIGDVPQTPLEIAIASTLVG